MVTIPVSVKLSAAHCLRSAPISVAATTPAIITMPTGTGKTAVLQASAFLLRANRVLVLTPSRLVREQIAEDFKKLGVLKRLGAVPANVNDPKVMATSGRITDHLEWEGLREFEVVVATVPSISPHMEQIPVPPADLFDLILVDEAHHSPAISWTATLDMLPRAMRQIQESFQPD
jgi:superfamily II DNA or RNA helicase